MSHDAAQTYAAPTSSPRSALKSSSFHLLEGTMNASTETATEPSERRRVPRLYVSLPAEVQTLSGSVGLRVSNISENGVLLHSVHVPAAGYSLHLTLHLPDGPLECVATVMRAMRGEGFACRMTVPGAHERTRWAAFLASLLQPAVMPHASLHDRRAWFDFNWTNAGGPEPR